MFHIGATGSLGCMSLTLHLSAKLNSSQEKEKTRCLQATLCSSSLIVIIPSSSATSAAHNANLFSNSSACGQCLCFSLVFLLRTARGSFVTAKRRPIGCLLRKKQQQHCIGAWKDGCAIFHRLNLRNPAVCKVSCGRTQKLRFVFDWTNTMLVLSF